MTFLPTKCCPHWPDQCGNFPNVLSMYLSHSLSTSYFDYKSQSLRMALHYVKYAVKPFRTDPSKQAFVIFRFYIS